MNRYHNKVLQKIKGGSNIFLFKGMSLEQFDKEMRHIFENCNKENVIFFGSNDIKEFNRILHKINKSIDVYQITCTVQIRLYIDDIVDFLFDEKENLFVTSSAALYQVIDILKIRLPIEKFYKILIIDELIYKIQNINYPDSLISHFAPINSFGIMSIFAMSLCCDWPILLFGVDGASDSKTAQYYNVYSRRNKEIFSEYKSMIYCDTICCNNLIPILKRELFSKYNIKTSKLININLESHYECFVKKDINYAAGQIRKNNKENLILKQTKIHLTSEESILHYNNIIAGINNFIRSSEVEKAIRILDHKLENLSLERKFKKKYLKKLEKKIRNFRDKILNK